MKPICIGQRTFWIEHRMAVVWWNPLTWLNWLDTRWDVMWSPVGGSACYCICTKLSKAAAREELRAIKAAEEAMKK